MEFPLNLLSDNDLKIVVKNSDYNSFLAPFKQNSKGYMQYNAMLGKKTKDSALVQKNLPGICVALYRKHDIQITKIMESCADGLANVLLKIVNSLVTEEISKRDLMEYNNDQIADLIQLYVESKGKDKNNNDFDFELFCVQLKLIGCLDIDERKDEIARLCNFDTDENEELVSDKDEIELPLHEEKSVAIRERSVQPPKPKQRKLTAQEKAAKNKAALEAKEKALADNTVEETIIEPVVSEDVEDSELADDALKTEEQIEHTYDNQEDGKVSTYIGVINTKLNYYNFTPVGILENEQVYSLSEADIDNDFPQTQKHNINFYYNLWDEKHKQFMEEHFYEDQPVYLNCITDDLEENRMADGTLNPTGYKVPALDGYDRGIIGPLSKLGLYRLIQKDALIDDIEKRKIIRISGEDIFEGDIVLVNLKDGFYAGPYTVKYSPTSYSNYIVMQAEEGKHYISGYQSSDCEKIDIETSRDVEEWIGYKHWIYYSVKENAKPVVKDIISDDELLESLKDAIEKNTEIDYANLNVSQIVDQLGTSQIIGESLPEEIKKQRISRIIQIMSDEEKLRQVVADASDLIFGLIINNQDDSQVNQLISDMFEKKPELLERVQSIHAVQMKIENAKVELEQLKAQKEEKAEEIKNMQADNASKVLSENMLDSMSAEVKSKQVELSNLLERINVANEAVELQDKVEKLKEDAKYYESHKAHLQNDAKNLESNFVELVNGYSERMADITFDGFMSSKMLQAAAVWEENTNKDQLSEAIVSINGIEPEITDPVKAVEYIVNTVQMVRPNYTRNDILNIMICSVQGFLTVFSGAPGCGKTSICNILAKTLGLNNTDIFSNGDLELRRYIPVSVERGWTSKRDFIGYYNPLTKAFEESNRDVFDGLRLLDAEKSLNYSKWPFYILLDEANLSPMEYYWADFMNVCDDLSDNSTINLGNNNVFSIPETLHFWATINNDHTTEILSPRLIDRAWVITLPKNWNVSEKRSIDNSSIKSISWNILKQSFSGNEKSIAFDRESKVIYEGLKEKLGKQGIYISPRVDLAILNYWAAGSQLMEEDEYGNSPQLIALDFAVAQKILPKFAGSGDEYESWLEEIRDYCEAKNLNFSASLVASIIERGNRKMKYYQFFD